MRLHYVEIAQIRFVALLENGTHVLFATEMGDYATGERSRWKVVLPGLQQTLRAGDWTATVAVRDETVITAVFPGFHDVTLGVAFDVGSTTVAGHLCDLHTGEVLASAGAMNPQIRFGEDLMSRVSYVMMHPGGEVELTAAVRACLDQLVGELCASADASREDILELVVVGNPIMHHLVFGFDPTELGGAPFALVTDEALTVPGRDLGLDVNPGARVYALPLIAGHVGQTRPASSCRRPPRPGRREPDRRRRTNAEIVLGNRDRLLAASSPTAGVRRRADLVRAAGRTGRDRARPDRHQTLELRYRTIGSESCPTSRAPPRRPASAVRASSSWSPSCSSPAC